MLVVSLAFRWSIGIGIFNSVFARYPHFSGPVIDTREMKEMFFNFSRKGHFVISPTQIGQSDLLLRALYFGFETMKGGDNFLKIVLSSADLVSTLLQLALFKLAFSVTAKKQGYTDMAFYWILFSPLTLFGGNCHANLGAFNDCLWYALVYFSVQASRR